MSYLERFGNYKKVVLSRELSGDNQRKQNIELSGKLSQAEHTPSACNPQFDFESFVPLLPDIPSFLEKKASPS